MSSNNNLKDYQKDQVAQIYKETFMSKTANLIAGIILVIPMIAIWVAFYLLVLTKPFFVNMAPNIRGIVFMAVLIIPILIAVFLRPLIKNFLTQKYN